MTFSFAAACTRAACEANFDILELEKLTCQTFNPGAIPAQRRNCPNCSRSFTNF